MKNSKVVLLRQRNFLSTVFVFVLLIPAILVIQHYFLKTHLLYGFRDMDWVFIKDYQLLPLTSIENIIGGWKKWGVYTYQMYYIGLQQQLFGINFEALNLTTHFFKLLSAITAFPLFFIITKNRLISFLGTILYASWYSTVGAMFSVVTSGNYPAVAVMNIFLSLYVYIVKNKISDFKLLGGSLLLFLLTLALSTERMYPLLFVILLTELFVVFLNKFSFNSRKIAIKRLSIFFIPVALGVIFKPDAFTQFFGNTDVLIERIFLGNWHLLLTPFTSFGSVFIPMEYGGILGKVTLDNLKAYVLFLLGGPLVIFTLLSYLVANLVKVDPIKFSIKIVGVFLVLSLFAYLLATNRQFVVENSRMHFDAASISITLVGIFFLILNMYVFLLWIKKRSENTRLVLSIGPLFAFLFVFLTWIPADINLVFVGPHRYLTVPALGSCLFYSVLLFLVYKNLRIRFGILAWSVFLVIIPIFLINYIIINKFFYDEVYFAGLHGGEQTRMKSKLWSYLPNYSNSEKSFFWFDESVDHQNGYFHESTVLAGFDTWMLFRGNNIVDPKLSPGMLRTNVYCPSNPPRHCLVKLKQLVKEDNGVKGIFYNNYFFKPENFYAFRLKDKDIINITDEVKKQLGI